MLVRLCLCCYLLLAFEYISILLRMCTYVHVVNSMNENLPPQRSEFDDALLAKLRGFASDLHNMIAAQFKLIAENMQESIDNNVCEMYRKVDLL